MFLIQDITSRKQAEDALRESQKQNEYLAGLLRASSQPVGIGYPEGGLGYVNHAFEELTGYSAAELSKMDWATVLTPPEWLPLELSKLEELNCTKRPVRYEKEYIRKDGRRVPVELLVHQSLDSTGVAFYYAFVTDITERKRNQQALRDSEERYHKLFEVESDAILLVDLGLNRFIDANAAASNLYGYSHNEFLELKPGDVSAEPNNTNQAIVSRETSVPLRWHRKKNGMQFPVEISGNYFSYQGKMVHVAAIRDITERKAAEKALRDSEEFAKATINALSARICVLDETGRILSVNGAWREFAVAHSSSPQLLLEGANYLAVCDAVTGPDAADAALAASIIRRTMEGACSPLSMEYACHSRVEQFWFVARVSRFSGAGPVRLVIAHQDITTRKQAEDALRVSTEQLRALAAKLQTVREEERASIAREIHDVLAQELTRISLDIAWVHRRLGQPLDDATRIALQKKTVSMREATNLAAQTVQRIATELRPVILDSLGLCPAIEWLAADFEKRTGIVCEVTLPKALPTLAQHRSTALFRILQESLTNIARHSGATRVTIELQFQRDQISLTVHDNGRGIAAEKLQSPRSIGLVGMRERASLLGGICDISSTPGKGTTIKTSLETNGQSKQTKDTDR